jgi:hypothetical protein
LLVEKSQDYGGLNAAGIILTSKLLAQRAGSQAVRDVLVMKIK